MHPPFVINVVMKIDDTHFFAVKTEVDGDAAPTTSRDPIPEAERRFRDNTTRDRSCYSPRQPTKLITTGSTTNLLLPQTIYNR